MTTKRTATRSPERPTGWYVGAPLRTRLHVAARWATGPFGSLDHLVPGHGSILDWGCGHGLLALWLAQRRAARYVHGVDLDEAKVAAARVAARQTPFADRVSFEVVGPDALPRAGRWDAVVVSDVLYLLPPRLQVTWLEAAAGALGPGGAVVVKEMGEAPRWKAAASRLQERIVVGTLGLTASPHGLHVPPSPTMIAEVLRGCGLAVTVHPLDRGYHCPHVAVIGRSPGT